MSQIAIIGGGPAGSLAGVLLARGGVGVSIVEQHRFPRHKVCGECLSALALEVLGRAGVLEDVYRARPARIGQFSLHAGGRSVTFALPRPMLGLSRFALDQILLDRARAAGASLIPPARCEEIAVDPSGRRAVSIAIRDLATNQVRSLTPQLVLLADGRRGLVDAPGATGDFGVKTHFAGVDLPRCAIHLFGFNGHYGGVAPIESGMWNLAVSVPAARVRACPNLEELVGRMMDENRAFAEAMRRARRVAPILTCPLPRFGLWRDWPENLVPLGNAACSIEPIGGEGMGLALASAAIVAPMVGDAIAKGRAVPAEEIRREFRRLWLTRRPACRVAAMAFSHRAIRSVAMRLVGSADWVREGLLRVMGKMEGAADECGVTQT